MLLFLSSFCIFRRFSLEHIQNVMYTIIKVREVTSTAFARIWYIKLGIAYTNAVPGYAVPSGGYLSATGSIDYGSIYRARTTADGTTITEVR